MFNKDKRGVSSALKIALVVILLSLVLLFFLIKIVTNIMNTGLK